mmetsp:Transcript_31574/g.99599  ORF Transcript_31574/g.99599 Transcript_31574/m.99599 type:complete len:275 (-) Transcript_31574:67-891(-)
MHVLLAPLVAGVGAGRPCLIVYHIGKAGGESIHAWVVRAGLKLWTHYDRGDDEIFARPSDRPKGTRQLVHDADVIMGHFTPASDRRGRFVDALRRRNFTRRCAEWTILRDPLDLQASMLAYLYGRHPDVWNDCLAAPTLDGDGPCTHRTQYRRHPMLRDCLCHTFDGQMDHWNTYNFKATHSTGPWPPPCRYESAQRALEALDGVGFTESMNESVIQPWVRHLGLSDRAPPYEATHATRSNRGFDALSTQIQRTIAETSRDDILLYRWARRRRA